MLYYLKVTNFGIITDIEMEYTDGLTLITGETGAGKSLLIGALRIVTGDRFSQNLVKKGCSASSITAGFTGPFPAAVTRACGEYSIPLGEELILRRTCHSEKKTKNFVNDTPVTLEFIKKLTTELIDMHGQFEHQSLLYSDYQLAYIDSAFDSGPVHSRYTAQYTAVQKIKARLQELENRHAVSPAELEWKQHQLSELQSITVTDKDFEELLQRITLAQKSTELVAEFSFLCHYLHDNDPAVIGTLAETVEKLNSFACLSGNISENIEKLSQTVNDLQDVVTAVRSFLDTTAGLDEDIDSLQAQVYRIQNILRKNNCLSIMEACALKNTLEQELTDIARYKETREAELNHLKESNEQLKKIGRRLTLDRQKAAAAIADCINQKLTSLNMNDAVFAIDIATDTDSPRSSGFDTVTFTLAANKETDAQPLRTIASGGELARLMLALKSHHAAHDNIPTLIFDEIDTGISGETAAKVAEELQTIARFRQVMCVTHQPAIAALPAVHYKISKQSSRQKTDVELCLLSAKQRVEEIAGLMSGGKVTKATRTSAAELISSLSQ